jgi:hypothetical protein
VKVFELAKLEEGVMQEEEDIFMGRDVIVILV